MSAPNRVIFLNRFFYPDHSATSQILSDLAFHLPPNGMRVRVITSRMKYDDPRAKLHKRQLIHGVKIRRVTTTRFGRYLLLGRLVDLVSFYLMSGCALWSIARRGDVVVAMTDPPLLSVLAAAIARRRGFKLFAWHQDVYPEVAFALGVGASHGLLARWLCRVRDWALRVASVNIAIGDDMAERLRVAGAAEKSLVVLPNWADDEGIQPLNYSRLRHEWNLDDRFVVAYSGNLGRAHDVETFLGAAEMLKHRSDIAFLFVGGGYGIAKLRMRLKAIGCENVLFQPYQARESLAQSLAAADVHWLSLKSGLDGLIVPSKFYGIAAAGRAMIVVSSQQMELRKLVTQHDCGVAVDLGDSRAFSDAVTTLAANPSRCRQMGKNARQMLDEKFTKAKALENWSELLRCIADGRDFPVYATAAVVGAKSADIASQP